MSCYDIGALLACSQQLQGLSRLYTCELSSHNVAGRERHAGQAASVPPLPRLHHLALPHIANVCINSSEWPPTQLTHLFSHGLGPHTELPADIGELAQLCTPGLCGGRLAHVGSSLLELSSVAEVRLEAMPELVQAAGDLTQLPSLTCPPCPAAVGVLKWLHARVPAVAGAGGCCRASADARLLGPQC